MHGPDVCDCPGGGDGAGNHRLHLSVDHGDRLGGSDVDCAGGSVPGLGGRAVVLVRSGGVLLSDDVGHGDRGEDGGVWNEPCTAHAARDRHCVRQYGTVDRGGKPPIGTVSGSMEP